MPDGELQALAVRCAGLFGPLTLALMLGLRRPPDRARLTGALLATVWNLPILLGLHLLATAGGWWRFDASGGLLIGMPFDLLLGWMLLWGAVPVLAFPTGPLWRPVGLLLALDLALMPLGQPVLLLGAGWLGGEVLGLAGGVVPGLLLARWTAEGRRLPARAAMQAVLAGLLLLWLVPLLTAGSTGGAPQMIAALPRPLAWLGVTALLLAMLPGIAAVQEFAERGGGTPLPYDPPVRLVTSGPYAYLANPMQLSVTLVLASLAVLAGDWRLAAAAVVTVAYGAGLARWHEGEQLAARHGERWTTYQRAVPAWRPSWRPAALDEPATLWVAMNCVQCAPVAAFFEQRGPVGLAVRPALRYPGSALRRVTYESAGRRSEGVAAVARALGHVHLGWALAGFALRLPGVEPLVQLLVDATGGGPRTIIPDAPSCAADGGPLHA